MLIHNQTQAGKKMLGRGRAILLGKVHKLAPPQVAQAPKQNSRSPGAPRVVLNRGKALLLGAELLGGNGASRTFLVGILHLGPQGTRLIHLALGGINVSQVKLGHTGGHGF